jgi:hypothetical protein
MLPAPLAEGEQLPGGHEFAGAVAEAGRIALDLLRRALTSIMSSLTALGSRANALFAQIAASLAFERAARETAASFGPKFFEQRWPRGDLGNGAWSPLLASMSRFSPGLPTFGMNPWAENPWTLFANTMEAMTNFWLPQAAPRRGGPSATPAPVTVSFALPGCAWSFTFG